jgi:hypothetical protein
MIPILQRHSTSSMVGDAEMTVSSLLAELRVAGRFAPRPKQWDAFFRAITRGTNRDDWPPFPLILSAHWSTTAAQKHERLAKHLRWAAERGRLEEAIAYLESLQSDDWRPLPFDRWEVSSGDL